MKNPTKNCNRSLSMSVRYLKTNPSSNGNHSVEAANSQEPTIHSYFEPETGTWQYIVADPSTSTAAIIDSVLDYDPNTLCITTHSADALLKSVHQNNYKIEWILETHAHADHLSAASYLQKKISQQQGHRPLIRIGKRIDQVQRLFSQRYGVHEEEYEVVFDKLFDDDEVFEIGNVKAQAMHLPGHTPDHLGYRIGGKALDIVFSYQRCSLRFTNNILDNVFCGDTIFHRDIGTARCDFPGGSANNLWNSAQKLLQLPDHVKIWTGHDYPAAGRIAPVACMTVKEHKEKNKHLNRNVAEEEFLAVRRGRDASLAAPRLLHQSLQVNIRAGHLPAPTEAGLRLLHVPIYIESSVF
jgi:glyoxylase-like metal-dependent hydrolase (beta-lactamase superfamily II)